jgi:hypothetical protein
MMPQKALAARHTINGRELEVKVATPKVYHFPIWHVNSILLMFFDIIME